MWAAVLTETKDASSHDFTQCAQRREQSSCLFRSRCPCPGTTAHPVCRHLLNHGPSFPSLFSSPIPSRLYSTAPQHSSPSQYHHTVSIERSPAHWKDFTERGCSKSLQKNKIPVGDTASASHRASWTDANAGCGLGPSRLQSRTAMAGVSAACHSCGRVKREARLDRSSRHLPPDAQRLCS